MKKYNKEYIPFTYRTFEHSLPIKGKLLLVNLLKLDDLFICTQLYNMFTLHSSITLILATATDEDVRISRGNRSKYYIFKKNKLLYHITKHY